MKYKPENSLIPFLVGIFFPISTLFDEIYHPKNVSIAFVPDIGYNNNQLWNCGPH